MGTAPFLARLFQLPLVRKQGKHDRLRAADGVGTDGSALFWSVEEVGEHRNTAIVDHLCLGVFVVVNEIFVQILMDEIARLWLHPGGHEAGQIERGVGVHVQLIVDELVGRVGRHALFWNFLGRHSLVKEALAVGAGMSSILFWRGAFRYHIFFFTSSKLFGGKKVAVVL